MSASTRDQGSQPATPLSADPAIARAWYVVLTKPRAEAQAQQQLLNQGYEVWLPLLTTWRKVAGAWVHKTTPFFPRYLFARPAHAGQSVGPIRSTLGVSSLVRFGIEPARLSEPLFADLQRLVCAQAQRPDLRTSPFTPGEGVAVTSGPLAGLGGIVTRSALERVTVLLQLLGREKEVVLQPGMLTKAA